MYDSYHLLAEVSITTTTGDSRFPEAWLLFVFPQLVWLVKWSIMVTSEFVHGTDMRCQRGCCRMWKFEAYAIL